VGDPRSWQIFNDRIVVVANCCDTSVLSRIQTNHPRELLVLSKEYEHGFGRHPDGSYRAEYKQSSRIGRNNADLAVLMGSAGFALRKRRFFRNFRTIVIGPSGWLFAVPGLIRYALKGDLAFTGVLRSQRGFLPALPFLVFENRRFGEMGDQRLFAPPDMSPMDILQLFSGINYVLLRWPLVVFGGNPVSDLDLLASDESIVCIRNVCARRLGLFPVDVYSASGAYGHAYKSAPYYPPHVARRLLAGTTVGPRGIKYLDDALAYLAFAYHLLFHKTDGVPPGAESLRESGLPNRHLDELGRLAAAAGKPVPEKFADLEQDLQTANMMPPLDTIGFYSNGNPFLAARYKRVSAAPGLSVLLVRDFGIEPDPQLEIRQLILKEGFIILHEGRIDSHTHKAALESIRGGNWYDKYTRTGVAYPTHYFVCQNLAPQRPRRRTLRRYPHLDDERLLLKIRIRDGFSKRRGQNTNIVHVSDNSAEAWQYIEALGVGDIITERLRAPKSA
jgi:hypothetical protein